MSSSTEHDCQCGARILVSTKVTWGSLGDEPDGDFLARNELRVTRRFAHEGAGVTQQCHDHILALRDDISRSDVSALRDLAPLLGHETPDKA